MRNCEVMSTTVLNEARRKLNVLDQSFDNVFPLGFEIWSAGPGGEYYGSAMGRFEPIIGEEQEGCPVYQQAHSKDIPSDYNILMYR